MAKSSGLALSSKPKQPNGNSSIAQSTVNCVNFTTVIPPLGFYHTPQRKEVQVKWHFFATSHGKGVVDGLRGTVKRVVWSAVSTRKVPSVLSAEVFAKTAEQFCKSTSTDNAKGDPQAFWTVTKPFTHSRKIDR